MKEKDAIKMLLDKKFEITRKNFRLYMDSKNTCTLLEFDKNFDFASDESYENIDDAIVMFIKKTEVSKND